MVVINFPGFVGETLELTQTLERIARALIERKCDFLLGAGMSSPPPSNVPTGRELGLKLLERFFGASTAADTLEKFLDAVPFECIAEAVENLPGKKRKDLSPLLRHLLVDSDPPINAAHQEFLSVFDWDGQRRLRRLYTTNFDKLIEKALAGRAVTV